MIFHATEQNLSGLFIFMLACFHFPFALGFSICHRVSFYPHLPSIFMWKCFTNCQTRTQQPSLKQDTIKHILTVSVWCHWESELQLKPTTLFEKVTIMLLILKWVLFCLISILTLLFHTAACFTYSYSSTGCKMCLNDRFLGEWTSAKVMWIWAQQSRLI